MVKVVVIVEFTDDALVLVDDSQHAVVVVHIAVGIDQGHAEGGNIRKAVHRASILFVKVVEQAKTVLCVVDDLVHRGEPLFTVEQTVAFGAAQVLVDASRHRADAVHSPAEDRLDDLLAPLAQHDHPPHQRGVRLDQAEDIALFGRGIHPEQHLGDDQVEICRRMRLQHLRVVAETADLLRRPRHPDSRSRADADHVVERFRATQMVTDEADSADPLHQHRRLPERVALDELLEAAELDDMQPGVDDVVVVVEVHGDLAVALDPGDGIDDQLSAHATPPRSVVMIQRAGQRDRATSYQIVEHREDGVRVRWTTGDEVVHLDHFVAGVDLGGDPGDIRVGGDDGFGTGTAVGELMYASDRQSFNSKTLRIAGTPPQTAQAPTEIRMSQLSRKCRSVSMLSSFATPPSMKPIAQRSVILLISVSEDR